LFDARADWKFKANFIVLRCTGSGSSAVRINVYGRTDDERTQVEQEREGQERQMKANTSTSAHWRNETYHNLPAVNISKAGGNVIVKQNFRLFSPEAMEQLMDDIDNALHQPRTTKMSIDDLLVHRVIR
jgi:hypothetical protein